MMYEEGGSAEEVAAYERRWIGGSFRGGVRGCCYVSLFFLGSCWGQLNRCGSALWGRTGLVAFLSFMSTAPVGVGGGYQQEVLSGSVPYYCPIGYFLNRK